MDKNKHLFASLGKHKIDSAIDGFPALLVLSFLLI